ncbi:unnamed protein product [Phyllotreta striolata]|uniref:Gustatory receptor n=1 Tax=Phyllotreta striolata TaxID=444603 RepID=A0A9N9XN16_PHYSR|nr:unnamed protein product [Phyllotreta striolata]
MTSEKVDTRLLRKFIIVGKILGVFPVKLPGEFAVKSLYTLYMLFVNTVTFGIYFNSFSYLRKMYYSMDPIDFALDTLTVLSSLLFVAVCRLKILNDRQTFHSLTESISKLKYVIDPKKIPLDKPEVALLTARMILGYLLLPLFYMKQSFFDVDEKRTAFFIRASPHIAAMIHQLAVFQVANWINVVLKYRFRYLRVRLTSLENLQRVDLKEVLMVYKRLSKIAAYTNSLFGWHIFLAFCCSVVATLNCINFFMYGEREVFAILPYAVNAVIYTVSAFKTTSYCVDVQEESNRIIQFCYSYQKNLRSTSLEECLKRFAKVCLRIKPDYSAAGFFKMERRLQATTFSVLVSYLIVIAQFHLSANDGRSSE